MNLAIALVSAWALLPSFAHADSACGKGYTLSGGGFRMDCKDQYDMDISFGVSVCVKSGDPKTYKYLIDSQNDAIYLSHVEPAYGAYVFGGIAKLSRYTGKAIGTDTFSVSSPSSGPDNQLSLSISKDPDVDNCYHGSLYLSGIRRLDTGKLMQPRNDAAVACIGVQDYPRLSDFAGCDY